MVIIFLLVRGFNPRSPRRERRYRSCKARQALVSIHAPREGSDRSSVKSVPLWSSFQSTLPAKGATLHEHIPGIEQGFNPRSPRRERQWRACRLWGGWNVSIHAPREGSDPFCRHHIGTPHSFNPRSPRRERRLLCPACLPRSVSIHAPREGSDVGLGFAQPPGHVSIHAPREGSDMRTCRMRTCRMRFNPRSPRRERLSLSAASFAPSLFQSTLPAKGATAFLAYKAFGGRFQSTLPAKGATGCTCPPSCWPVSIHAPREGSDIGEQLPADGEDVSIHAPREGSDAYRLPCAADPQSFNPRSPRRERPAL